MNVKCENALAFQINLGFLPIRESNSSGNLNTADEVQQNKNIKNRKTKILNKNRSKIQLE